ncbi:MAG TPA: hypothetical protein DIT94_17325 [Deltaproteobacteria bacterium]|nr:hypothetical protein [Deltaproteobacteria bacterium]
MKLASGSSPGTQKKRPSCSSRTEFLVEKEKNLCKTDERWSIHSFKALLNEMGTLCRNQYRFKPEGLL